MADDQRTALPRRGAWLWVVWALAIAGVVFVAVRYADSTAPLPVSDSAASAVTPVGEQVFVSMFAPGDDFERSLAMSGVKVSTTAGAEVEVEPLLCRAGTFDVTVEPEVFCAELLNPEGQTLAAGDTIVVQVSGEVPTVAVVERVRIGFRDGLQWGTQDAGRSAEVQIVDR